MTPTLKTFPAWAQQLGLDVTIDSTSFDQVTRYLTLRHRWDRTHNLMGPAARADSWQTDVLDSLALLSLLRPLPLIDVGSGGGVPGLLLSCLLTEPLPIKLIESHAKRTAFLRTACRQLGLQHVSVYRGRWPIELTNDTQIVSRAVVPPDQWPKLATLPGLHVQSFFRFLGETRPEVHVEGFKLAEAVDYGTDAHRRLERWDRVGDTM